MQTSGPGEWYLSRDGQSHGPVTDEELRKLVELGHLRPTDYVWRDGFQSWLPASEVPGLLAPSPGTPPPFATRPPQQGHAVVATRAPIAHQGGAPVQSGGAPTGYLQPQAQQGTGLALAAYIMLLLFFVPLVPLVGLIIAIVNVNAQPEWVATHYQWQWRTVAKGFLLFLGGLLVSIAGAAIFPLLGLLGTLIMLGVLVWVIVRHARGLVALNRQQPIPNVRSWGW